MSIELKGASNRAKWKYGIYIATVTFGMKGRIVVFVILYYSTKFDTSFSFLNTVMDFCLSFLLTVILTCLFGIKS